MKLELDENKGQVLINLLDIAVKTAGLQAAEACVYFTKEIQSGLEKDKETVVE